MCVAIAQGGGARQLSQSCKIHMQTRSPCSNDQSTNLTRAHIVQLCKKDLVVGPCLYLLSCLHAAEENDYACGEQDLASDVLAYLLLLPKFAKPSHFAQVNPCCEEWDGESGVIF